MKALRGSTSSLRWAIPVVGLGLWLATARAQPAIAQNVELATCRASLQECSDMLTELQQQRDAASAALTQCETTLANAQFELELLRKAKSPGGLTHRDALALMDLSMDVLQKAAESNISPAESLEATRKLRFYQTKATGLSLKLTQRATQALPTREPSWTLPSPTTP